MASDELCALCGGELEEQDVTDEREKELRDHVDTLEDAEVHATVCTECGHIAYYKKT